MDLRPASHLPALGDELLGHTASPEGVVAGAGVDGKRCFIRAFVQRVEIDPETQDTRLLLRDLSISAG